VKLTSYTYAGGMTLLIALGLFAYKCTDIKVPDGINSKETSQASKMRKKLKKVTTIKTKPDGTSETTITEEAEIVKTASQRKNRIDASIKRSYDRIKDPSIYEITYSRRVLDNIWLGVGAGTDRTVHIKAGVEF
jgi:hypothetical protein